MAVRTYHCIHKVENPSIPTTKCYDIEGRYAHPYHVCKSCDEKYIVGKPNSFASENNSWAVQIS